ncbi:hypothetical protein MPSI1_002372 [Malassezia psittaci]|uniref:ATPase dynein-related AAA domain-containing protein n=1 Tax=Malassezia psittaci TaxID=1821823 RepID=A0AAF0JEG9_9BASI|nr:hypothetical protein MPSI1_002372 [Malassezia psittaci]
MGGRSRLHALTRHFYTGAKRDATHTAPDAQTPAKSIGTLRIGPNVAIPLVEADQPTRLPPERLLLDIDDPLVLEHLEFLGKKWQLRQDVFLASPPGPYARRLCQTFASLVQVPVEYVSLHRDIGEAELLQQRSLEAGGNLRYDDGPVVRAMKNGHILILEGIERAERGVMPILNNILENREHNLPDGTQLVPAERFVKMDEPSTEHARFVPVHPDFRVFCLGKPVPPYKGHPLDPPFRSRFQARWVEGAVFPALPIYVAEGGKEHSAQLTARWSQLAALVQKHAEVTQSSDQLPSTSQLPHIPATAVPLWRDLSTVFAPVSDLASVTSTGAPADVNAASTTNPASSSQAPISMPGTDRIADPTPRRVPTDKKLPSIAQPTLAMLSSAYPAMLDMSNDKQAVLRDMLQRLALGNGVGDGCESIYEQGAGFLGYRIESITPPANQDVADSLIAKLTFSHIHTNHRVTVDVPCGSQALLPLEQLAAHFPDIQLTPRVWSILSMMLQMHALGRDMVLVPAVLESTSFHAQASSSKSVCIGLFAALLGYPVDTLWLYKDIGGNELLMRRGTTPDGATIWYPAPLTKCAVDGRLVHLAGADVLGTTIESLSRLTQDRELELWEGTRLSLAPPGTFGKLINGEVSPMARNLRLVVSAPNAAQWLTEDVATMFATIATPPMTAAEERQVLEKQTQVNPNQLEKLLAFAERYRKESADPNVGLHKARRLGTRQLLRFAKRLAHFPETDMYAMIWRNQLADFLPRTVRDLVKVMLLETGIVPHGYEGTSQYIPPLQVAPPEIHSTEHTLSFRSLDSHKSLLAVPQYDWQQYDPDGRSLIPNAHGSFFHNAQQSHLLYSLVQDMVVLKEHLLLMGAQGTGKNKIIDQALELLDRPREYIQMNRDSTVGELLQRAYLEDGQLRYSDSPLVRAVKLGRVIVVDEVDKCSASVSAVFKSLAERGELSLPDGRRVVPHGSKARDAIQVHKDFRLVLLANRPGWPFLGNAFTDVIGEGFSCYAVANPDAKSEQELLERMAPNVDPSLIQKLVSAFQDLRLAFDEDLINHPYSLRELIHLVRHLNQYPDEPLREVMLNMLSFDLYRPEAMKLIQETFARHGLKIGYVSVESLRAEAAEKAKQNAGKVDYDPPGDTSLDKPKDGVEDDEVHVGGNTFRGGTGGRDTAGLGGRGGYERLYKGHKIHQIPDELKKDVPEHIAEEARAMARKALQEKLKSDRIEPEEAQYLAQIQKQVESQVQHLANVLNALTANEHERKWMVRQQEGQLDERRLSEGLVGERAIFKRRQEAPPEIGAPQTKPKRIRIILDASASMYHMQYDGRLTREVEAAMLIMEAMQRVDPSRFAFDMVAHSGDTAVIPLIRLNQLPKTDGDRFRILRDLVTIMRFCFSGDNTVECIEESIQSVAQDENADDYFVIALSDANLARYHISPELLGHALKSNEKVKSAVIFIDKGPEASQAAQILRGRAFVAENTRDIPRILSDILTTMVAGQ